MSKYAVIVEKGENNYSAYIPDVPGCIATGASIDEVRRKLSQALETHLELMREAGEPLPQPNTVAEYVEVA